MIVYLINAQGIRKYDDVVWVETYTNSGNFILLSGHAPLITTLLANKPLVLMQKNEQSELIHLQKNAIFEIVHDVITVIM